MGSDYPNVSVKNMLVDAAATALCLDPCQFDVMVMENMFGDILSDQAGGIIGSLGLMPSACVGEKKSYFEPSHGSAPDIAGQSKANPLAMVMSFAMMLKYSFNMQEDSELVEKAVQNVLLKGLRTADIKDGAKKIISTKEMGDAVIQELKLLSGN